MLSKKPVEKDIFSKSNKVVLVVIQSPSHVWLFEISWTAACQASLSLTISWSLPKFMSTESNAIQLSHPLSPSFPSASNLSQHQGVFQWVSSLHQVAKVLEVQLVRKWLNFKIIHQMWNKLLLSSGLPYSITINMLFSHSGMSDSLRPHGLQHTSLPCPSQHLLELAQTPVHQVGDSIQPSHPLSSRSPTFSLSQHQVLFQWVSSLHQVAKVLELQLQHQSFQWIFRIGFLWAWLVYLLAVRGTFKSFL